jgi:hypothetical protein
MIEPMWALILGAVIAGAAYLGYAAKFKGIAMLVGVLMVGAALFLPGYGLYEFETPPVDTTIVSAGSCDITMTNGSWATSNLSGTVSDDGKTMTFVLDCAKSANTMTKHHGSINFSIVPVAPTGSTADDLIVVNYYVNEKQKYSGEYIFEESGDDWTADWMTEGAVEFDDGEGRTTLLYTDDFWAEFRFDLSSGTDSLGSEMQTVGESTSFSIVFSTASWSETYTVILITTETS